MEAYVELSAVHPTWTYNGQQYVYAGLPLGVKTRDIQLRVLPNDYQNH